MKAVNILRTTINYLCMIASLKILLKHFLALSWKHWIINKYKVETEFNTWRFKFKWQHSFNHWKAAWKPRKLPAGHKLRGAPPHAPRILVGRVSICGRSSQSYLSTLPSNFVFVKLFNHHCAKIQRDRPTHPTQAYLPCSFSLKLHFLSIRDAYLAFLLLLLLPLLLSSSESPKLPWIAPVWSSFVRFLPLILFQVEFE